MLANLQKESQQGSALLIEDEGETAKEKKHQPQQDEERITGSADTEVDSSDRSGKSIREKQSANNSSTIILIPLSISRFESPKPHGRWW